jgi:hypothetical protein
MQNASASLTENILGLAAVTPIIAEEMRKEYISTAYRNKRVEGDEL